MRVLLKVEKSHTDANGNPKRGRRPKPIYTPAVIDDARIDFAFVDEDGDINIRIKDDSGLYIIRNTDNLFDRICDIVDNRHPKVRGLGK